MVETLKNSTTHTILKRYNTVIKTYADGSQKIKSSNYSKFKGHSGKRDRSSKSDDEELKRLKYKNLYNTKSNLIDLVYHNSLIEPWEYFVTLTFNPEEVDSLDYQEVSTALAKWINNMKHQNPLMSYILVPELHKSGRIHWHGVFKNVPNWNLVPARSPNTNRLIYKNGVQIFNLANYKYGHTTVSKIKNQEAVSVYCSKYMTKDMIDLAYKKRYWSSRNLKRPTKTYALFDESTLQFYIEKGKVTYQNDKSVFIESDFDIAKKLFDVLE